MENRPIRLIRERLVYSDSTNPWVRLYFDEVIKPDGPGRYNRIVEAPEKAGPAVIVIPVGNSGRLGFISIYRYPVNRWLLEFPRGFGEPGLDMLSNAKKELFEETGLAAEAVELIGRIYPNSGLLTTEVSVLRATGVVEAESTPSSSECISGLFFLDKQEIADRVVQGEVADGITLAALSLLWCRGLL